MHRTDRTEHAGEGRPAVSVVGLTRTFGDLKALDALSFDVGAGELFGIVGPDGSGKTTTLRILAGVLRPTDGDATVVGTSVAKDPEGVKHRIAYMFQFGVPMRGSFVALVLAAFVYILTALSLGLLISTVSKTQQEAFMTSQITLDRTS